jgi:hypothetical protein
MKSKILFLGAIGAAAIMVAACHHDNDNNSSPPSTTTPPSSTQALDTAQVLTLAQATSETSTPFAVNGGALTLTDTSETSTPVSVNAQ